LLFSLFERRQLNFLYFQKIDDDGQKMVKGGMPLSRKYCALNKSANNHDYDSDRAGCQWLRPLQRSVDGDDGCAPSARAWARAPPHLRLGTKVSHPHLCPNYSAWGGAALFAPFVFAPRPTSTMGVGSREVHCSTGVVRVCFERRAGCVAGRAWREQRLGASLRGIASALGRGCALGLLVSRVPQPRS
jgi:hypothetical protein